MALFARGVCLREEASEREELKNKITRNDLGRKYNYCFVSVISPGSTNQAHK